MVNAKIIFKRLPQNQVAGMSILTRLIQTLQQENMIDFDYCEEYLRSTKKNSIMAALRKGNFRSVDIDRFIKHVVKRK